MKSKSTCAYAKMNKAAILKKAADYIVHLQRMNQTLVSDNTRMAALLAQVTERRLFFIIIILSFFCSQYIVRLKDYLYSDCTLHGVSI